MAGLFGSITIKGNRLTDIAAQTATVGIPIPFGFGKYPVDGNIGFAALPPKEHVKKKKQGKGGVKTEEYSYTTSYAIMFCEGPIFGYWTIKRNGKVVWTQDPNASVEDRAYAAKWAQKATFYYGTETQLPDSTIESYKGSGRVSAFRGIAYIVVEDDDVTDNGGAVPSYEAVVIASPPEAYLTSHPYTQYHDGNFYVEPFFVAASTRNLQIQYDWEPPENISVEPFFVQVRTTDGLYIHAQPPENYRLTPIFVSAYTKAVQVTHIQPFENYRLTPIFVSAYSKNVLITHNTQPPENVKVAPFFVSASTTG